MRTSVSSKANHLTWRDLRSDMRAPSRDAQPLEGRDRAFFSYLQGAAESSRTSITLACEHGHTRRKRSARKESDFAGHNGINHGHRRECRNLIASKHLRTAFTQIDLLYGS